MSTKTSHVTGTHLYFGDGVAGTDKPTFYSTMLTRCDIDSLMIISRYPSSRNSMLPQILPQQLEFATNHLSLVKPYSAYLPKFRHLIIGQAA